jgi:hypothetical protein
MLNYREERIAMMRFFVEVHRIQREKTGLGDLSALAVGWIVALGRLEGRPFNASKISSYLSIPRTTVLRKLQCLIQASFVEQRDHEYYLAPKAEIYRTPNMRRSPLRFTTSAAKSKCPKWKPQRRLASPFQIKC